MATKKTSKEKKEFLKKKKIDKKVAQKKGKLSNAKVDLFSEVEIVGVGVSSKKSQVKKKASSKAQSGEKKSSKSKALGVSSKKDLSKKKQVKKKNSGKVISEKNKEKTSYKKKKASEESKKKISSKKKVISEPKIKVKRTKEKTDKKERTNEENKKKISSKKKVRSETKIKKTKKEKVKNIPKVDDRTYNIIDNPLMLDKSERKRVDVMRATFLITFALLFLLVIIKVGYIEVFHSVKGVNLKELSQDQYTQTNYVDSARGTIYDNSGNELAVNIKEYKMYAVLDPNNKKYNISKLKYEDYYVEDPTKTAEEIIKVLEYEDNPDAQEIIIEQLNQDPNKYSQVEFGVYGDDISLEQRDELVSLGLPGLYFIEKDNRYYPYGELGSYILGYAKQYEDENGDISIVGEMGIEKVLDDYLRGEDGEVVQEVDRQGVPLTKDQILKSKVDGTDVYLTIDMTIQSYVHDYMKEAIDGHEFETASTVVMDADTGAILAAEKFGTFDPNLKDIEDYTDPYFQTCFEPGSTIKTLLIATAMQEGVWDKDNVAPSGIRKNDQWGDSQGGDDNYIADWLYNEHKLTWGDITWEQGYYVSSNVIMTYILDEIGYKKWQEYATNVWELGQPIQNELYESETCTYEPEYDFEVATTTFGQGMTASIMQILRAYSTFSGDGKMVTPFIVDKIVDSDTKDIVYDGHKDLPKNWKGKKGVNFDEDLGVYTKKVITEEENQQILELMQGGANYDSGIDNLKATGTMYGETTDYDIGAKTGTSQISINGTYNNNETISSVIIMAPADDPEIILYTDVVKPQESYPQGYMSEYTGNIINNTLNYLTQDKKDLEDYEVNEINYTRVGSYKDKDMDEAKDLVSKDGFGYYSFGSGNVKYQYPLSGSNINRQQKIYLIGEKVNLDEFKGLTKEDMVNICRETDQECSFEGSGTVDKVVQENKKYLITLK